MPFCKLLKLVRGVHVRRTSNRTQVVRACPLTQCSFLLRPFKSQRTLDKIWDPATRVDAERAACPEKVARSENLPSDRLPRTQRAGEGLKSDAHEYAKVCVYGEAGDSRPALRQGGPAD